MELMSSRMSECNIRATSLYSASIPSPQEEGLSRDDDERQEENIEESSPVQEERWSASDNNSEQSKMHEESKSRRFNRRFLFKVLSSNGCSRIARIPETWPRMFWFFFGVVAPLWLLIGVACICGYGLARLESPTEIAMNDERLATFYETDLLFNQTTEIMAASPEICLSLYVTNTTLHDALYMYSNITDDNTLTPFERLMMLEAYKNIALSGNISNSSTSSTINTPSALTFMASCGQAIVQYSTETLRYGFDVTTRATLLTKRLDNLTFHWNRCANDTVDNVLLDLPWYGGEQVNMAYDFVSNDECTCKPVHSF